MTSNPDNVLFLTTTINNLVNIINTFLIFNLRDNLDITVVSVQDILNMCFRALDKKYAYLLKSIMFQDGFFDYVMSGAKGTKMPRGDKTHIMLYPIPRFSETQLLKFIEYNKISFGEGGRMRSLSRVSRKQRYSTLDFPAENRVPTGMQNSPESIKAFAVFDVTFNIYS